MAIGRRPNARQEVLFVATSEISTSVHPFYSGTGYEERLRERARASGIKTPTRKELAKLDRKRSKKGSNAEWVHPGGPEAWSGKRLLDAMLLAAPK